MHRMIIAPFAHATSVEARRRYGSSICAWRKPAQGMERSTTQKATKANARPETLTRDLELRFGLTINGQLTEASDCSGTASVIPPSESFEKASKVLTIGFGAAIYLCAC